MQQIKTIALNHYEPDMISIGSTEDDGAMNTLLSEGWRVLDIATHFKEDGAIDTYVTRIFTLIRDIPDATKAQDATQEKAREFRVGQDVSVTLYGEIVSINGYEIKVDFDEFAQPIVCVEQQLEPLNAD